MSRVAETVTSGKREPVWPAYKPARQDPVLGKKEMSPEQTLVEFISTSAALHGVRKQPLRSLEWDLLKVFPYNIMPANAAAWYMAKRKYYADQPTDLQLLPFLLKKYPDKFIVNKFQVEFTEVYSKDTARKKLNYLVQFGLDAYFSHKVDEYGVYFFDPNYYERTEPFHESLRLCTKGNRSRLVAGYFAENKKQYNFQMHSSSLASVSKQPGRKVMTNTTGVIVSMVNNQYGFIKFGIGEKALFCAKALFRDGWHYSGDPLRLPAMFFDAYQVSGIKSDNNETCKWFATLVWCGRKPAPKYYSTCADFNATPVGFVKPAAEIMEGKRLRQPSSSMMIGQVVGIRKNGAVVSVRDDSQEKIFIPGWSKENEKRSGVWLTTLTGDTIGMRDLVAYYIDSNETMPGYTAVGKNVMVLKEHEEVESNKQRRNYRSVSMSTGGDYEPRGNLSTTSGGDTSTESSEESEAEQVSDSELEWLENDLDEMIEKDGPMAKTHSLFIRLKKSLNEVRATVPQKRRTRESGKDSGMESNSTTPRGKNTPMKTPTKTDTKDVFWRTKVAFAKIDENYRSSDDEDYESGDEIQIFGGESRRRRRSTVSSVGGFGGTTTARTRRQRRSTVTDAESVAESIATTTTTTKEEGMKEERKLLPYWVRAISLPEEYDEQTGLFVPIDKWYKEDKDGDYVLPLSDDDFEEDEDASEADEATEEVAATEDKAAEKPASDAEAAAEDKEDLETELKLLLEEGAKELPEDLIEGKHRPNSSAPKQPSPEKIVVTKPEEDNQAEEIIEIVEPLQEHKFWHQADYIKFVQELYEELPKEDESKESNDPDYVPAPIIVDSDLDYDEYDPEEEIDPAEIAGLTEDLGKELWKEANMIPIWVHVDSVKERKSRAAAESAEREKERQEKEAALAAAAVALEAERKEAEEAKKAAGDQAEKVTRAKVDAVTTPQPITA